ncbi:UNVERIFIED_CONTAM: hypothetical protein K2H54_075019, partial [Gekko kuhli]
MAWTVRPHHATNLQGRDFQVQGLYQSQQAASGFSQHHSLAQQILCRDQQISTIIGHRKIVLILYK